MPGNAREKFYPQDQAEGLRQQAQKFPRAEKVAKEKKPLPPSPEEEAIRKRLANQEQALNKSLPKN